MSNKTNKLDKNMTLQDIARKVESGMTIGIGGWGGRRKPMAFIRQLLKTPVKDLTVISYAGCDLGLLLAAKKVRKVVFAFATLDAIPIEPHFRAARQEGAFQLSEIDEGMLQTGLKAGAARLPFLPTRAGIASDVLRKDVGIKTIKSPYEDAEELVAMPAIRPDIAICHVNKADIAGNSWIFGPDPFFDEWFCRAAHEAYLTAEEIVETDIFASPEMALRMPIERSCVNGVALAPFGAHPTSCAPAYGIDVDHLKIYGAATGAGFSEYFDKYVALDEQSYLAAVGGERRLRALALPGF